MKKTRKILISIMLCLCAFILLKGNVGTANAKTFTTKAQVKSEIKKVNQKISKLNKEIAKDKKQYKIYNARSKKKTKGCFPILLGRIISRNPFVVYNWDKYFHVKNPAKGAEYLGTYTAEVKYTGKSVNYDGMNVDTVMVISDPDRRKAKAIKNRYQKKQGKLRPYLAKRNKLKKALTYKIKGDTRDIYLNYKCSENELGPKNTYYNKISWKSSNKSIVTVSAKGKLKGIKAGVATITAKTNISKKTSTFKVYVKESEKLNVEDTSIRVAVGEEKSIGFSVDDGVDFDDVLEDAKITSTDKKVCEGYTDDSEDGGIYVYGLAKGTAKITIKYKYYIAEITVEVYEKEANDSDDNKDYDNTGDDSDSDYDYDEDDSDNDRDYDSDAEDSDNDGDYDGDEEDEVDEEDMIPGGSASLVAKSVAKTPTDIG